MALIVVDSWMEKTNQMFLVRCVTVGVVLDEVELLL